MKKFYIGTALVAIQLLIAGSAGQAQEKPGDFFDFFYQNPASTADMERYTPLPWAGSSYVADGTTIKGIFQDQIDAGELTGIFLRNDTAPISANTTTGRTALGKVLGWATVLDYVLADFENGHTTNETDMTEMVRLVRNARRDADGNVVYVPTTGYSLIPNVNNAYIGNYDYFLSTPATSLRYPGTQYSDDLSEPRPSNINNQRRSEVYTSSGVNVSQPACYPYSVMYKHSALSGIAGRSNSTDWIAFDHDRDSYLSDGTANPNATPTIDFRTPNERSALFYSPLEKLSTARRNLPAGHLLIPNVCVWWPNTYDPDANGDDQRGYVSIVPEREDAIALIQHYRMRGTDGIQNYKVTQTKTRTWPSLTSYGYAGETQIPQDSWLYPYTNEMYRQDLTAAWAGDQRGADTNGDDLISSSDTGTLSTQLDDIFNTAPVRSILNLNTTKTTGLEWSGVRSVNTVKILVSNLGNVAQAADLTGSGYVLPTSTNGLPATTTNVPAGTHQMFTYTLVNLLNNGQFGTDTNSWTLRSDTTRDATLACLKMQNNAGTSAATNTLGALYALPVRTEPGAKMTIKVSARKPSSTSPNATVRITYKKYDADDNYLGNDVILKSYSVTSSTATDFGALSTDVFTIPAGVKYIRPLIQNLTSTSTAPSSTQILYVDNIVTKFAS